MNSLFKKSCACVLLVFASVGRSGVAVKAAELSNSTSDAIRLESNAKSAGRQLAHFWSECVGSGHASLGLRASWLEQLKLVHDQCGFRYVRFHGLFSDDMFVYHETTNGLPFYNWQYVDDLFDRMLAIGVRPFVELSFCPKQLASGTNTGFWWRANTSPPKNNAKWAALVTAFVRHCENRYGVEEVRSWYFEVWNEPDLNFFWHGTRSQYFELYKTTAQAIKAVDARLRVGGPATSNFVPDDRFDGERLERSKVAGLITPADSEKFPWHPVWVAQFLDYCEREKLPVDFVSTHPYPTDWALDEAGAQHRLTRQVEATARDLKLLRSIIDHSAFPHAEIQLTEWSSSPSPRDFSHDCLPAATFVVQANLESIGLADSLSYWTFSDVFEEGGAGDTIFHGGFGLVNYQSIVKPTFHAYQFLNELGDEILAQTNGAIVTRHRDSGKLTALVWHYPSEMKIAPPQTDSLKAAEAVMAIGSPAALKLVLTGLPAGAAMELQTLDQTHGNAVAAWEAMGSPEPPTREQAAELRKKAMALKRERLHADGAGRLVLDQPIEPWSLVLVQQQ